MQANEITLRLFALRDAPYAAMQQKILPTVQAERIIGVRTPALRAFAKELYQNAGRDAFLAALPHRYFDEDQLHAFVISLEKDFDACVARVEAFLPYIDNWATCDQMSPKAFGKAPERLLPCIRHWLGSGSAYTVRFAIGMLMRYFLDGNFRPEYPAMVAAVRSEEYYVRMMIAWYFATALAKQYDAALPYLAERRLDKWTHNKAIQKSVESFRISDARKRYLKALRIGKTAE